jgi:hypothetical protein
MADGKFFKYFPTIPYDTFDDSLKYKVVMDIFRRVRVTLQARADHFVYYNYTVKDGETPDILAFKYYGSSKYYWVIMLMNAIRDPQWEWVLSQRQFEKYIEKKYGGAPTALGTHSHWETKEIKARATDDNYTAGDVILSSGLIQSSDFTFSYTPIHSGVPDTNNIQTFTSSQILVERSMFQQEVKANEDKRTIFLLRRDLLGEFVKEFESTITKRI